MHNHGVASGMVCKSQNCKSPINSRALGLYIFNCKKTDQRLENKTVNLRLLQSEAKIRNGQLNIEKRNNLF